MTNIAFESSQSSGSIVELYTVAYLAQVWYYTTNDEDVTVQGNTFLSIPISRENVSSSIEETFAQFKVEFPVDTDFIDQFKESPPSGQFTMKVERFHRNDPDSEKSLMFLGDVVDISLNAQTASVVCESSSQTLKVPGLKRQYQFLCPHDLYGAKCKLVSEEFFVSADVNVIDRSKVTVASLAGYDDGYFSGGYIEYTHSGLATIERIGIYESIGSSGVIKLFSFPVGMALGSTVKVFPGCDRSFDTCANKFNNHENFGGCPVMPTKNPFGFDPFF